MKFPGTQEGGSYMANCDICNTKLSFFALGSTRCKACSSRMEQAKIYYINQIDTSFYQVGVTPEVERQILQAIQSMRMPADVSAPIFAHLRYLQKFVGAMFPSFGLVFI
jgi:hypothetical protein